MFLQMSITYNSVGITYGKLLQYVLMYLMIILYFYSFIIYYLVSILVIKALFDDEMFTPTSRIKYICLCFYVRTSDGRPLS